MLEDFWSTGFDVECSRNTILGRASNRLGCAKYCICFTCRYHPPLSHGGRTSSQDITTSELVVGGGGSGDGKHQMGAVFFYWWSTWEVFLSIFQKPILTHFCLSFYFNRPASLSGVTS